MVQALEDEKNFLEQSVEAGQVQKEIFYDETDKIQNVQQQEIVKLKSMLLFREQVIRFSSMSCSILTTFRPLRSRWIMSTSRRTMTHKSKVWKAKFKGYLESRAFTRTLKWVFCVQYEFLLSAHQSALICGDFHTRKWKTVHFLSFRSFYLYFNFHPRSWSCLCVVFHLILFFLICNFLLSTVGE